MSVRLPVLMPESRGQRYSCHSCGYCCRELVVHLFPADAASIDRGGWSSRLGVAPYVRAGKSIVLNKRPGGACVFLDDDGLCMIHKRDGASAKPLACRLFPFSISRGRQDWTAQLRFDCPSVAGSRGAPLTTHRAEVALLAGELSELVASRARRRLLQRGVEGTEQEFESVASGVVRLLRGGGVGADGLDLRLRCGAWVCSMLARARLEKVRGARLEELVEVLCGGAAEEISAEARASAAPRERSLLRQSAYAFGISEGLAAVSGGRLGRLGIIVRQLRDARRYRRGRGVVPSAGEGGSEVLFERLEAVGACVGGDAARVADLMTRFVCGRIRFIGRVGYYDWPMFDALLGLWCQVMVISWRGRLHAAAGGREAMCFDDVAKAVGEVDRSAGRVRAMGIFSERVRSRFLVTRGAFGRLLTSWPIVAAD